MKKLLAVAAIGAMAIVPAVASAAPSATAAATASGKTVSFSGGKLVVATSKKKTTYIVDKSTDCGYSKGQMGDGMPCSNLKKSKYLGKSVTVQWKLDEKDRRVASLVSVHL